MKKFFTSLSSITIKAPTVMLTLALVVTVFSIASLSMAQGTRPISFIGGDNNAVIDRNGSLAIGSLTIPQWIRTGIDSPTSLISCIGNTNDNSLRDGTCLDVNGSVAFDHVNSERPLNLMGKTVIDESNGFIFPASDPSEFIIADTSGSDDTILISTLSSANLTTPGPQRQLCSDTRGVLVSCGVVPPNVPVAENGVCGLANAGSFSSSPAINLCNIGTASSVTTNTNTYTWTCSGSNGGSNTSCTANRVSYAWSTGNWSSCVSNTQTRTVTCQSSTGQTVSSSFCSGSAPSSTINCNSPITGSCDNFVRNSCNDGVPNDAAISDTSTQYRWRCDGQFGGSNSGTCSIGIPINGSCDNSTRNSCVTGLANDAVVNDTSSAYRWRCDGINGGSNSGTCSIRRLVPIGPGDGDGSGGTTIVGCDQVCDPSQNIICDSSQSNAGGAVLSCQGSGQQGPTSGSGVCAYYDSSGFGGVGSWQNC